MSNLMRRIGMRRIGLAMLIVAATVVAAPKADAQDRWSWRHPRSSRNSYSTHHFNVAPYYYAPYYAGRVPYVPYYGVGGGGYQWHTAPSYYNWTGPGYHYSWRNPGTSVYYGPGYHYQYYW